MVHCHMFVHFQELVWCHFGDLWFEFVQFLGNQSQMFETSIEAFLLQGKAWRLADHLTVCGLKIQN